ncbi:GNAT family N-acetyltransferase [Nocardioides lianchengensis]|uniref:Phosphinothricin acetyltransferase n=1 Tax=Nocardioides lianchengensis TaxID=1045774 RepID=A0A1G6YND7_9ACTN|nr:GNAT family N-acetyltransferase [Nocardioides lianchengensis]NYG09585.1 phosphinothricin acetyltransferase [Nocardioides lianchengensis]SDD91919.1 phosphinothricin acetyltransferase [Nocardioides lianchengensis]
MPVRSATAADLPAIKAIYDGQVAGGIATFDLEPPPVSYWEHRLASTDRGDHLLVADEDGVVGYAYSSAYRPRPAYRHTRETSVYVDPAAHGRGLGRALYDELLRRLRTDGMRTAVAVVALPNPGSRALHRACGFEPVGVLREVGHKFDRWIDTEWWQIALAG